MTKEFKHIKGLIPLMLNFAALESSVEKEFEKAEILAQEFLFEKMRENVSLVCHSLKTLKLLDHPYAKRSPRQIHEPGWLIHTQEGNLLNAVEKTTEKLSDGTKIRSVGIDKSKAPYVDDIIFGTSTMVARDFITGTFQQVETVLMGFYDAAQTNALKHHK